jgi:hypothetical protein
MKLVFWRWLGAQFDAAAEAEAALMQPAAEVVP